MKRVYPNIWGRGALFAFSGLEGCTTYEGSMCGQLLGHRIGMSFDKDAAQLHIRWFGVENYDFSIVASDIILGTANENDDFGFLFVNECTVVGFCKNGQGLPVCHADLLMPCMLTDGICYSDKTVCYALVKKETEEQLLFAFSRGATEEQATHQARKALETDISAAVEKKLAWFEKVPVLEEESLIRNQTLAKTFSVMKSQVYTPEDMFQQRWTTPDRLPHKKCWLWDSVFHALGNYYIEPALARESIKSVFDAQQKNGFIPHMFWPGNVWTHTQAPVLAWGIMQLYQRDGEKEWILPLFEKLESYLNWNINNRDSDRNGLFEWFVDLDEPNCRCGESGCDNSPRFDDVTPMDAIDFSCFMANEFRCMSKLAKALDMEEKAQRYDKLYKNIKEKINSLLFDPVDGRYYDREIESGKLRKISAVTSFLPLFAGICSPEQAAILVKDLQNPNTFGTPFGVPSIAKTDPAYGTDMWRGPVWINFNYFIILGLREYGYKALAESLKESTLQQIEKWYQNDGVVYEFYDCDNEKSPSHLARKAVCLNPADDTVWVCAIRDYGWSNTLYAALALEG